MYKIIQDAAEETIGKENNAQRKTEWFDEECAKATKRKNAAYMRLLNRRTRQIEEYKQLKREEKKIHKGKKKNIFKRNCKN